MSTATISPPPAPAAPPLQKETTAGSYFITNYPPFNFWKPEFVPALLDALKRPPTQPQTPDPRL